MNQPRHGNARLRQSYYWRVRNARLPMLARINAEEVWHIAPGHPGGAWASVDHGPGRPEYHLPTVLTRAEPGSGRSVYCAACLRCSWEGEELSGRDAEGRAVEGAHDHACPPWRTLRPVPLAEAGGSRAVVVAQMGPGAPVVVQGPGRGVRHWLPCSRLPVYCIAARPRRAAARGGQNPLF
ncbi:DUF6349 family protein [Streptomyces smyrnaeus]|uniref:DUF6349 family protein n=1 Tax=Streptomyces smyrnaeus TaxID=1387713 RepID=UPI0035578BE8